MILLLLFVGIIIVHEFMEHHVALKFFLSTLSLLQVILANFQLCMQLVRHYDTCHKVLYP